MAIHVLCFAAHPCCPWATMEESRWVGLGLGLAQGESHSRKRLAGKQKEPEAEAKVGGPDPEEDKEVLKFVAMHKAARSSFRRGVHRTLER